MTPPLRHAVIGVNGIGRHHVRWAQRTPGVELAAVADLDDPTIALPAATRYFDDYHAMLAAVPLDALSICLPHHLLAPAAQAGLRAGLHVLVEKPFALRLSDADAMIEAARATGRQLAACFQYRTYATPRTMKEIVDSGQLGTLRRVLWTWSSFRSQQYYQRAAWRGSWEGAGGGVLMSQVSHDLDLLCWLFGEPATVTAQVGNQLGRTPLEDIVSATIRFKSGLLATFQATINQPRAGSMRHIAGDAGILMLDDVKSLHANRMDRFRLGVYQTSVAEALRHPEHHYQSAICWQRFPSRHYPAWARIRGSQRVVALVRRVLGQSPRPVVRGGHSVVLNNFAAACRGEEPLLIPAAAARQTVELINAILYAALTQQTVHLPLDPAAYDSLWEELAHEQQRSGR